MIGIILRDSRFCVHVLGPSSAGLLDRGCQAKHLKHVELQASTYHPRLHHVLTTKTCTCCQGLFFKLNGRPAPKRSAPLGPQSTPLSQTSHPKCASTPTTPPLLAKHPTQSAKCFQTPHSRSAPKSAPLSQTPHPQRT